jgi:hypothetical protein
MSVKLSVHGVSRIEKMVKEREMPLLSDFICYEAFDINNRSLGEVTFYSGAGVSKIKEQKVI